MPYVKVLGVPVHYTSSGSMPKGCMLPWYLLWLVLSVGSLGLGVKNFIDEEAWFAHALPATGTITGYDLHVRNDGRSDFCQRIEFTTQAGEPATTYGDCSGSRDESQIGKQVSLYYDPNKPSDGRTRGLFNDEGSGLIFGIIGAVFFSLFVWVPLVAPFVGKLARATKIIQPMAAPYDWAASSNDGSAQPAQSILLQDAERYHANQRAAAERERREARRHPAGQQPAGPASAATGAAPAADLARQDEDLERQSAELARQAEALRQQSEELRQKIEERRRQQGQ